jgi:hypothetical protein
MHRMRIEKCQIVGNRSLDPVGFHAAVIVVAAGQRLLPPRDHSRIWRGRQKLPHQRLTPLRND